MSCTITDEYSRRGIDIVLMENDRLAVEILAGKGGDVTEIRDKRTDINVLFESPHEWRSLGGGTAGAPDGSFAFMDHYPGGWQDVLPAAGGPATVEGAPLALHGEASLVPWESTIIADSAERVAVRLSVSLSRYPFRIERELTLREGASRLRVQETLTNLGEMRTPYSWLQHLAFGPPLIGPEAHVTVPCETVLSDPDHDPPNTRFPAGERFEWPVVELDNDTLDLRRIPAKDRRIHDLLALTDLTDGHYVISNPKIDLEAQVTFPTETFEYVWYWGAFGGFEAAPYFGRNYNLGLEPSTSVPNAGLQRAIDNGTANWLGPGETAEVTMTVETREVGSG